MFSLLSAKVLKNQGPPVKANVPLLSGRARPHTRRPRAGQLREGRTFLHPQPIDVPRRGSTGLQPPKDFSACGPPTGPVHRLVFVPSSQPPGQHLATHRPGSSSPPREPWLCLRIDDTASFMTDVSQRPSRPSQTLDPERAHESPWTISKLRCACGPGFACHQPRCSHLYLLQCSHIPPEV